MLIAIVMVQSAINGAIMKEVVVQKRKDIARLAEQELTLARQGESPDPRPFELVHILARRAAREWYKRIAQEHRVKRS
jgi:hypothetical protein